VDTTRIDLSTVADFTPEAWWWYADGTPVDMTGCTAALALRVTPTDAAPLFAISTTPSAAGVIVLGTLGGGNPGLVQIAISRSVWAIVAAAGAIPPVAHGELVITLSLGGVYEFLHVDAFIWQGSTY
jgi:hypothetical protein